MRETPGFFSAIGWAVAALLAGIVVWVLVVGLLAILFKGMGA